MTDTYDTELEERSPGRNLELIEHLSELRTRLVRSLVYVSAGTLVGWFLYFSVFRILSAPVNAYLVQHKGDAMIMTGLADGFVLRMKLSVLIGLIVAVPFVTREGWGFIAPGLTRAEKRGVKLVAPLSVLLFAAGVAIAYWILPEGVAWLAAQNPPGARFLPSAEPTLTFILKMFLAFGLVFQMPVILMFLGRIGVINSRFLKTYWRHAIVIISIIAAVATPSNDAFSMIMMSIPMIILYVLSIGLVKIVEKK